MLKNIETITDRSLFGNILNRFFIGSPAFIPTAKGNIEIKFLNVSEDLVKVYIPADLDEPGNCMAFTRHGPNIIFVFLKLVEKNSDDIYLFNPAKFQVIAAERRDERKILLRDDNENSVIYITNFISDKVIRRLLSGQGSKLEHIKEVIEYDTSGEYDHLKIYFCHESINDPRMKYFYNSRLPIYIEDIHSLSEAGDHKNYKSSIYDQDVYLRLHNDLISEISVPILFDSKIPYGYIQVNRRSSFPSSAVPAVKRLASLTDELGKRNRLFSVSADKLLVSDVSLKGIGVVFKDQKYIPYYKKDSFVSMDVLLPMAKKASMLADVRHLEMMQNSIIKVGFQIKDMDEASKDNYERFLGSVSE